MDEQKLKIFNAIATFVQDLNNVFGKKNKPVALYNRLLERTTLRDVEAVERHMTAFTQFFNNNPNYVQQKKLSDNSTIVYTPERIYLDMGKLIKKSDEETQTAIHQHLTLIYSLLNLGTKQGKQALETLKQSATINEDSDPIDFDLNVPDTNEGKFLKKTITGMTKQLKNLDTTSSNPMSMMTSMLQSGFLTSFVSDLQSEFSSGKMNMGSLINTVTTVMGQTAGADSGNLSQLTGLLTNSLAASGGDGGGEMPNMSHLMGMLSQMGGSGGAGGAGPDLSQLGNIVSQLVPKGDLPKLQDKQE